MANTVTGTPQLDDHPAEVKQELEPGQPPVSEDSPAEAPAAGTAPPQESAPRPPAPPLSAKLRGALAVLSLGLRTVLTAAMAAFRQATPADGESAASPFEILQTAHQGTLETSLAHAQEEIQKLRAELKNTLQLLHNREHDIGELQSEMRASGEAAARAENKLRADLERAQEAIQQKQGENSSLANEVAHLRAELQQQRSALEDGRSQLEAVQAEADRQRTDAVLAQAAAVESIKQQAARDHDQLQGQLQKACDQTQQTAASNAELQARLSELETQLHALEDVSQKLTSREKGLAEKTEEADLLRADLLAQRRRVAELESELSDLGERNKTQEDLRHELRRNATRLDVLSEELAKVRARADRLEVTVREFYLQAIDPITVAAASADLTASSPLLSASDRENVGAMRDKLDIVLAAMKRLVSDMNELGIVTGTKG